MTDDELKALVASLAVSQAELTTQQKRTDEQLAKTDAQLAKTDAQLAKLSAKVDRIAEMVGNISNNQGDVAEEFFYRSFINNDVWLGQMHFDRIYRNQSGYEGKLEDEFDIVLVNIESVAVIEVKQKAHPNLINTMLNKKLPNFRQLFPCYKELKLYGAIASMVSNNELIQTSKEAGLFFLTQKADHVVLVNDEVKAF